MNLRVHGLRTGSSSATTTGLVPLEPSLLLSITVVTVNLVLRTGLLLLTTDHLTMTAFSVSIPLIRAGKCFCETPRATSWSLGRRK